MKRILLCAALLALPLYVGAASNPAKPLEQELARIAPAARSDVGIFALHVESGRIAAFNGDVVFPMASTKKIAIAVQLLTLVDRKKLRLDTPIVLQEADLFSNGTQPVGHYARAGSSLTINDLLALMLTVSDNNATDILLRLAGGSSAVNARLRELGIERMSVDSPTSVVIARLLGRADVTEANPLTPKQMDELRASKPAQTVLDAQALAYARDSRDASTPNAMAALLLKIWNKQALSATSTEVLLGVLYRCELGDDRLKGLLPQGTAVAHKTGGAAGTTNDVGIIDLPNGVGHVIAVVLTKEGVPAESAKREAVIAQAGRAIYDYFLFTSDAKN